MIMNLDLRRSIRHSLWICWKDLLEFSRSKIRVAMLILMPLLMMVMIGFIFPNSNSLNNTPVAIANLDQGASIPTGYGQNVTINEGNLFYNILDNVSSQTGMMDLSNSTGFDNIKTQIQDGNIDAGIIIPENFTTLIIENKQANVTVITDQTNPQMSLMLEGILSNVISQIGSYMAVGNLNYQLHLNVSYSQVVPIQSDFKGIIAGNPNYFEFVAPGIMAMVVMMALMTGLPHAISYEKDVGTLDGMLVAPIRKFSIIFGKTLAQTIRGLIQGFIVLLLAIFLFGVTINGSLWLVLLIILLNVFSFVGLGILITSFTDKEETATMVMMTIMFPMMFFSGVFFPIQQMPNFMQYIAKVLPLTYATSALRKVMVLGAPLSAIMGQIIFLVAFGVAFMIIAIPMFKKAMSR